MIGKTISHYEIVSKLGEGGMGEVWEALDQRLDRTVAIKLIPKHLSADPAARKRFVHEAKAASSIEHANICTIHEIDETPEGETFIVMPRYQGELLSDRIAGGRLPLDEALRIVEDLAGALAAAHDNDIIHRDVKPANIIVDPHGRPILLDFGLAKLTEQTKVTRTGTTVGTLAYMAPEQAAGKDVDGRADLFSLGVVLYELVAGVRPFRGDHDAAVLYSIAHEPAAPLASHDPSLPDMLQTIIDSALAKEPAGRYASLHEFKSAIADLRRQLQTAGASNQREKAALPPRIRWMLPVAAVVIVLAVVALWNLFSDRVDVETAEPAIAVMDFNDLTSDDEPNRAMGMSGLIHVGMVENGACRVVSPSYLQDIRRRLFDVERGPIEESQALEVARESGASVVLSGQIGEADGAHYAVWELIDTESGEIVAASRAEGGQLAALADAVLDGVLPALARQCGVEQPRETRSVTTLTTADPKAYEYFIAGEVALEQRQLDEAIRLYEKAVARDTTFALAYFRLARAHRTRLVYGEARVNTEQAWKWRSHLSIQDRMRLEAWREQLFYRPVAAIDVYRELHARWPDDKGILEELAYQLFFWYFHSESAEICEHGMTLFPNEPSFALLHQASLACLNRPQEALAAARRLVAQFPENPNHWDELALRFIGAGMPDSAAVAFNEALERDPRFVSSREGLAALPYYRGDPDGAYENLSQLFESNDISTDAAYRGRVSEILPLGPVWMLYETGRYSQLFKEFDDAGRSLTDPVDRFYHGRYRCRHLLRTGRQEEALRWVDTTATRLAESGGTTVESLQLAGIARYTALEFRAMALVALDSLDAGRVAAGALMQAATEFGNQVRIQALVAYARIALAQEDRAAAQESLKQLAGVPLGLGQQAIEILEVRASLLHLLGKPDEAVAVHKELLKMYGGHALSHYQLGLLYEEMDQSENAKREYERFLDMWAEADEGLPQFIDARKKLLTLRQSLD